MKGHISANENIDIRKPHFLGGANLSKRYHLSVSNRSNNLDRTVSHPGFLYKYPNIQNNDLVKSNKPLGPYVFTCDVLGLYTNCTCQFR